MIIIPEGAVSSLIGFRRCVDAVEQVFASMAKGTAKNLPVVREEIGHADAIFGVKSGFDRAAKVLGLKAGGFWPANIEQGLTNHQSSVFLFDPDTGKCRAMVGGNLLTAMRTAAASAISIKYLARKDAKVLGMIGAGHQSTYQMRAAIEFGQFERVVGWNIQAEQLSRLAIVASDMGLPFEAVERDTLGAQADVIITITSSFEPLLNAAQVRPGTHISCMGTDTRGKQEVDADLVVTASVFTDEIEQAVTIGECQHAFNQGRLDRSRITALGAVIVGDHQGRSTADEITLFDGTGIALQDLAVASVVVEEAIRRGVAVEVDF
ncbi:ornithine cyclodeaminase family protein [Mesorhizobium sp. M7A.F.Ca.US.006.01.1.1]|uniref:iminosuccinate reductase BhcD n=1 Tax=Mesorhizobium sp. M7A.F.Ca.US.006.01.1.1 TaxID=2496707 RepID=UPI000FCA4D13|nr:iminosuccinate reductase BhcD [Mesorhizobium sp. M7A.F.Ca.US.006.01.1.1]RUZ71297.1 ornithine cyclodeaminase family protein [Mesorhizobium sp. M7A.F.Ca.US.006.01.1.1]